MPTSTKGDFYDQMTRLMPVFLREIASRQDKIFTRGNISVSNIVVIDVLKEKGACTMGELSRTLNLTMSAATAIINKMIDQSLVKRERQEKDRRVVRVSLRPKGIEVAKKIYELRRDVTNDLFAMLTDREREEHLRILKKMFTSITGTGNDK
jgi:MarR family transcriptional regulator, organic hydroperoxide resistance regulator